MIRFLLILVMACLTSSGFAQLENKPKETKAKMDWSKTNVYKRTSDHLMLQFGAAGMVGKPDTFSTTGFSRTANVYILFDFPFKKDPRLSVAIGPGIGSDNYFFKNTTIDIKRQAGIDFARDTLNKYKKYKLNTSYLEVPIELRWSARPDNMNKGFKAAFGMKVGTILDAKVKAKVDRDVNGNAGYWYKEKSKRSFNGTRLSLIGRVGWGNFTAFASYTFSEYFKQGLGPTGVHPWSAGLCISGL
jgi:hypothetical protein